MDVGPVDLELGQILSYTMGYYGKIDAEVSLGHSSTWLALGHYIIMIVDGTHLLKRCYEDQNYKNLSSNKDL